MGRNGKRRISKAWLTCCCLYRIPKEDVLHYRVIKNNDFALLVLVYKLKCYFAAAGTVTWYGVRLWVQNWVRHFHYFLSLLSGKLNEAYSRTL